MELALTADPALAAQATVLARAVAEHAREADYPGGLAMPLAHAAMAFSLAGEAARTAGPAAECLAAAAASPFREDSAAAALAVDALTGIDMVAEALAGLSAGRRHWQGGNVLRSRRPACSPSPDQGI